MRILPLSPVMADTPPPPPFGRRELLAFGAGDLAFNIIWGLMLSYLEYFYTDICLFPPACVALILLCARALSIVTDPLVGMVIDRRPAGRQALPLLRMGIVPFAVMIVLAFVPVGGDAATGAGRYVWACVTYMGLCVAYSVTNTAYGALTSLISARPEIRLRLASARMVGAGLGALLIAVMTMPCVDWLGHGDRRRGFMLFMMGVAVVVAALLGLVARLCHERVGAHPGRQPVRVLARALLRNGGWLRLTGAMILVMLGSTFMFGALVYYVRFVLRGSDHDAGWMLGAMNVLGLCGSLSSGALARRWGNRGVMGVGTCLCGTWLALAWLAPPGWGVTIAATCLFGACMGVCNPACFALLADYVEDGARRSGVRTAGLAWALNSTASKLAFDGGGSMLAWLLAGSGLVAGDHAQAAAARAGIGAGFLAIPACAFLGAGAMVLLLCRAPVVASGPASGPASGAAPPARQTPAPQNPVDAVKSTASPPPT
ncbi:MFS transporter [Novacetimonas pomaceti]|uniref:MFS transporter n=1 Tax=Novacetimonas pomaceti TaxID=2021998 RepID=UPI001EF0F6D5|nr:MFS transporter [Novacetimonas pomaceti]